jgi:hypothetical protein
MRLSCPSRSKPFHDLGEDISRPFVAFAQCSIVAPVGIVPNVLVSDIGGWHGVHVATAVFAYERFAE